MPLFSSLSRYFPLFKKSRPDPVVEPFRIQKLPLLALEEILKNFEPIELINLSRCSKRIKWDVVRISKHYSGAKINIFVVFSLCSFVEIKYRDTIFTELFLLESDFPVEQSNRRRRFLDRFIDRQPRYPTRNQILMVKAITSGLRNVSITWTENEFRMIQMILENASKMFHSDKLEIKVIIGNYEESRLIWLEMSQWLRFNPQSLALIIDPIEKQKWHMVDRVMSPLRYDYSYYRYNR